MEAIMRTIGVIGAVGLGWIVGCGGGHPDSQQPSLPATATVISPAGNTAQKTQLWASDGTPQGTRILKQINPQGWAVFRTNGTPSGTRPVSSGLWPMSGLSVQSGKAIFVGYPQSASDSSTNGLWGCDLETGSQHLLIPMAGFVLPHWDDNVGPRFNGGFALVEVQERWNPDRFGLWRTDGTPEGSYRLRDLGSATGWVAQARGFKGRTYFAADDGVHGIELWVTDGTVEGTRLLKDLVPGTGGSFPGFSWAAYLPTGGFIEFNGKLYFGAGGPEFSDHVLWVTDGTTEGTKSLTSLPGTDPRAPKLPAAYCVVGDTLYFSAQTVGNSPYTRQLWRTNGTQEGTQQVTSFDFGQNWNPIWSIQPSPRP